MGSVFLFKTLYEINKIAQKKMDEDKIVSYLEKEQTMKRAAWKAVKSDSINVKGWYVNKKGEYSKSAKKIKLSELYVMDELEIVDGKLYNKVVDLESYNDPIYIDDETLNFIKTAQSLRR
jgi:hypothetical protein